MVQMESLDVDLVRDLRMGERPRRVKYMRRADLAVERRREVRWLNWVEFMFIVGGGKFGSKRGVGA